MPKNKLIIVATCRSGFEYDFLEKRLPHNLTIESVFDKVVTYDKVPKSQAHLIASKLDIN
ncbi:hypothetical protein Metho_1397 [Methanomethylovorans hollandica DSM 15978]|uniref:Uncharacterized protein n=1 Tax=Methanomethylovorans hollandica (strain DSM 15978 / NBRC 107637 / DMS1) TaxID=867904 RepID=L0KZT1_METHD|nr:hypothetical protein Metho_1397 [Methanomethylovorans hollandica DSM 15978]